MTTLDATQARIEFTETISRAGYGKEWIRITRHGKPLAAVVPIEDLELLERLAESRNPVGGDHARA